MNSKHFQFIFCVGCCALVGNVLFLGTGVVESLYVADHYGRVFSFDVYNNQLDFQGQASLPYADGVNIAIDNESDILFRIVESVTIIQIIDAKTLNLIKTVTLPVYPNAGIVYDAANSRLLCTERNSNRLYIILWDPVLQTLTYQSPYIALSHIFPNFARKNCKLNTRL